MNRALKILVSVSLLANACLGGALMFLPSPKSGYPGGGRNATSEVAETSGMSSSLDTSGDSSDSVAGSVNHSKAISTNLFLPAKALSKLLSYDYVSLRVDAVFADAFDLNPRQSEELNVKLASWVAQAKEMERAGLKLVTDDTGSYYRIAVDAKARQSLFDEIAREIKEIEGIHQADTITSVILAHPRLSALGHDQQIAYSQGTAGEIYFESDEIQVMISPSDPIYGLARARYGHLIDFSTDHTHSR